MNRKGAKYLRKERKELIIKYILFATFAFSSVIEPAVSEPAVGELVVGELVESVESVELSKYASLR